MKFIIFFSLLFNSCASIRKPASNLEPQSIEEEAWMNWVDNTANTNSILSLSNELQTKDLDPLAKMLGKGEVVALGENDHGIHEFPEFRNRLFKYLVKEQGFKVIALESGILESYKVEKYIHGDKSLSIEEVLREGITHGMGHYQETKDLIVWMRDYNLKQKKQSDRLHFIGFDLPVVGDAPILPLRDFAQYLKQVDPQYYDKVMPEILILAEEAYKVTGQIRAALKLRFGAETEIDPDLLDSFSSIGYEQLSEVEQAELRSSIKKLQVHLKENANEYKEKSSKNSFDWHFHLLEVANQHLRDLENRKPSFDNPNKKIWGYATAVSYLKEAGILASLDQSRINLERNVDESYLTNINISAEERAAAFLENSKGRETRELANAENVKWIYETYGKTMVFAHVGHSMKGSSNKVELKIGELKVAGAGAYGQGYFMKKFFADNYVMISTSFGQKVDASGVAITEDHGISFEAVESCSDCTERAFIAKSDLSSPAYFLDLRKISGSAYEWINQMRMGRWQSGFQKINLIDSVDVLIYFPKVSPSHKSI